jgi:hypothetical protein
VAARANSHRERVWTGQFDFFIASEGLKGAALLRSVSTVYGCFALVFQSRFNELLLKKLSRCRCR